MDRFDSKDIARILERRVSQRLNQKALSKNMKKTPKRKHLVKSASYWFNAARKNQNKGKMAEALMCMENAYNHVENALAAEQNALALERKNFKDLVKATFKCLKAVGEAYTRKIEAIRAGEES